MWKDGVNVNRTVLSSRPGVTVAATIGMLLSGCSITDAAQTNAQQEERYQAAHVEPGAPASNTALTSLPDANYGNADLLAARKRGLSSESAEDAAPEKTGTIDPIALDPYTRSEYPDVVARWGKLLPTVERERRKAAKLAAADARCDGVDNAQVTDNGTRTERHYVIECNNITRFYFSTASLAQDKSSMVRNAADMGAEGVMDY